MRPRRSRSSGPGRSSRRPTSRAPRTSSTRPEPQARRRFVYVSSPSVAHSGSSLIGAPAGPADPDAARDNYSRSKAAGELLALAAAADDFAVVAVRPHLVWGPGDTQLIGRIVERARQGRLAVIGSGAALVDTTYVSNAGDAIVAAADHADEQSGRAFVVSNGQPRPVRELLDRIVVAAGLEPPRLRVPVAVAARRGERARTRLGTHEPPRRSADHEIPRRAAVDCPLVRPA